MRNPATPLGLPVTGSFEPVVVDYSVAITSPSAGASLSPSSVVAVSFSISPSAPAATANLYDGATLVGTATVSGTSGTVTTSAPLSSGTRSLTVALVVGGVTHTSTAVSVTVRSALISMTVGAAFAAAAAASSIVWTLPDATTATTQTVDYTGTAGTATLSAAGMTVLNFGYDAGDGGDVWGQGTNATWNAALATYGRAATSITAISGLADGAPGLQRFFGSGTALGSVDFSGCTNLRVVEFFYAANAVGNISVVTFDGCTGLLRVCFERGNLQALDLSDVAAIIDIRGREQNGGASNFAITLGSLEYTEHLCVGSCWPGRSVTGIDGVLTGTIACPRIRELWTWGCNRAVVFSPTLGGGSGFLDIQSWGSLHTGLNTSGISWPVSNSNLLDLHGNPLTTCVISALTAARCRTLNLADCNMSQVLVDHVLEMYATSSALTTGTITLTGNAVPSATGLGYVATIRARGMTVTVAE